MEDDTKKIFLFKEDPMVAGLVLVGPLIEPDPTVATPLKVKMGEGLGIPSPLPSLLHANFYFLANNIITYALCKGSSGM